MRAYVDEGTTSISGRWIVLLILCFCCNSLSWSQTEKVYTVGIVPQFEIRKLYSIWQPVLDQLERDTGLKFGLLGSPSIPEFEKDLLTGKFDFAYMNPYHLVWSQKTHRYRPLIRDHSKNLQGILVVRKDNPVTDVKQLNGKTIAFPAPNALGASLLIRAELQNLQNINIIPRYVKTHDSVYMNVVLKQTAAGGGIQKTLTQQKPFISNQLRVLYRTQKVAPHPFTAHPRVNADIVKQIQQALLKMDITESGKNLLTKIPIKKIGPAQMDDYSPLIKMQLEQFHTED